MKPGIPSNFKRTPNSNEEAVPQLEEHLLLCKAWDAAPEALKVEATKALASIHPRSFKLLFESAMITGFTPKVLAMRPPAFRSRLDESIRRKPTLLRMTLLSYFQDYAPDLNQKFLRMMKEQELEPMRSDPEKVDAALGELRNTWRTDTPGQFELFEASLQTLVPGWWQAWPNPSLEPLTHTTESEEPAPSELDQLEAIPEPVSQGATAPTPNPTIAPLPPTDHELAPLSEATPEPPFTWCQIQDLPGWLASLESDLKRLDSDFARARSANDLTPLVKRLAEIELRVQVNEEGALPCAAPDNLRHACLQLRDGLRLGFRDPKVLEAIVAFREVHETYAIRRRELSLQLARNRQALGLQGGTDMPPVTCADVETLLSQLEADHLALEAETARLRNELRKELVSLGDRYELSFERISKRDQLLVALDAGSADSLVRVELENLLNDLTRDCSAWRHDQVVAALERDGLKGKGLVDLAQALLATKDIPLTLSYLRILQELPVEDSELEDFGPFIVTLLEALIKQFPDGEWVDLLMDQPWLAGLGREDILDEKVAAALCGVLLAAEVCSPDSLSHLWNGFRGPAVLASAPILGRLAEAVTSRRKWAWEDPSIETELEASRSTLEIAANNALGDFMKNHRQFREHLREVQYKLRNAWMDVREGRTTDLDPETLCEEFAAETRGQTAKRFLCQAFDEDIKDFFEGLQKHLILASRYQERPEILLSREEFRTEVNVLVAGTPVLERIWAFAGAVLEGSQVPKAVGPSPFVAMMLGSSSYARLLPEVVNRFNADPTAALMQEDLLTIVTRIGNPLQLQDVMDLLRSGGSFQQLWRLQADQGLPEDEPGPEVFRARLLRRILTHIPLERQEDLQRALVEGRFAWVEREVSAREQDHQQDLQFRSVALNASLMGVRDALRKCEDQVIDSNGDEPWRLETQTHLEALLRFVMVALGPQQTIEEKQQAFDSLASVLGGVQDHVRYQGRDFTLFDLPPVEGLAPPEPEPLPEDPDREFLRSLSQNLAERTDVKEVRESVGEFLKTFARITKMHSYREEATEQAKLQALVDFPFKWLSTTFQKPGCYLFEQPLRLFLIPGQTPSRDYLDRIQREMELNRGQAIHILLLPGLKQNAHRILTEEQTTGDLVVLDQGNLEQIFSSRRPHSALRQILRRRVSLERASPFMSTGNVDKDRHIYVSIGKIAEKVQDGNNWIILGGRRSGKSSLLHALKKTFLGKKSPHMVALVSLETLPHHGVSEEDLDLLVARRIAEEFGWPTLPQSLSDFEQTLRAQCRATRSYVLLDEVDYYVRWHRNSGLKEFQVIRKLRELSLGNRGSAAAGLFCFFSGFKNLYEVYRNPDPSDASYPWGNSLEMKSMPQMTLPETQTMVEEGFSDLLGIEVDHTVPPLIFKLTAGHPAFVQNLCNSILSQLESQGRATDALRITQDEVTKAYNFSGDISAREPFIHFVEATLNLNLSNLDKVIAYSIAVSIIHPDEDPERPVTRDQIDSDLIHWFNLCGRPMPSSQDITEALLNLTMTGMLKEQRGQRAYNMTFPTFVNILRRLEDANRNLLFELINDLEN